MGVLLPLHSFPVSIVMYSSNGQSCPPGWYYSAGHEDCRDCENICGNQYGGSDTLECQTNCPDYGQSTHATTTVTQSPSFEDDLKPWWIWLVVSLVALLVLVIVLVVCLKNLKKFRKCQKKCWLQATEELVRPDAEEVVVIMQESNHSGKDMMVVS